MTGRPAAIETVGTGKGGKVTWFSNPYGPGGDAGKFIIHLDIGLLVFTKGFARRVEEYAKENAPWVDRTGGARDGLRAIGEQRLVTYSITLFHTIEYGLWLEVRWDGKYAIIVPTIEHMGPELMAELAALNLGGIAKLGGG